MTDRPVVSVVIPVLDGAHGLTVTLDALAAQEGAPPVEVLVVDNGSHDESVEVASAHPVVTTVLREAMRGPYAARNTGMAAARGAVIALTDADCRPVMGWLRAGVAAIDAGADLVGGAIVQRSTGPDPTMWERYDRGTYLQQKRYVEAQNFAATANLFVRASVVAAIGPFRPELTASGDYEFGRRAVAGGYRLVYSEEAAVLHEPRTTLRDTWKLHRKLGSGFAELARAGLRDPMWKDRGLRVSLGQVSEDIAADGGYVRYRRLAPVHAVAMGARWVGRLTGRG